MAFELPIWRGSFAPGADGVLYTPEGGGRTYYVLRSPADLPPEYVSAAARAMNATTKARLKRAKVQP